MKKAIAIGAAWSLPFVALAQTVESIIARVGSILNLLVPVIISLALIAFFWGLFQYIWGGAEEKDKGKNIMVWGVIALFVMVSIFGIIRVIGLTFGIEQGGRINIPSIPR